MTTKLQTALELREWQKKFNPTQPVKAVTTLIKKHKTASQSKYLTTTFFAR
ncbi:hypothetical protein RBA25_000938 [Cronobacter turicensis]|nr:hypothetical protein [Cronobacter turicensis]EKY3176899.1 hypothetical protein [Cronobacter turicensis]ELY3774206.1 hypothetical protein [Cronobacter dublinensis]